MFTSMFCELDRHTLPAFKGIRIMMMPFVFQEAAKSLPKYLGGWVPIIEELIGDAVGINDVGYVTIDEAVVGAGECHRRPGLHIDGVGGWGGGNWGGYEGKDGIEAPWHLKCADYATGMILLASHPLCKAYYQSFQGDPGYEGDCEHLREEIATDGTWLLGGRSYWVGTKCVHEGLPAPAVTKRQFLRISSPSEYPWYEGYTANPLGVQPPCGTMPAREEFMAYRA